MKDDGANKTIPVNSDSFDALSDENLATKDIYPTPEPSASSHSFINDSQINDTHIDNGLEDVKSPSYNAKKPLKSVAAALLRVAGIVMVIQYIFIIIFLIIGNLSITVNPDTGEKINGPESIIPSIIREWKSFVIFIIGVVCIYISHKAFKGNKTKTHK